jgi:hypothetical protein
MIPRTVGEMVLTIPVVLFLCSSVFVFPRSLPIFVMMVSIALKSTLTHIMVLLPFSRARVVRVSILWDIALTAITIVILFIPFETISPFGELVHNAPFSPTLCLILVCMPLFSTEDGRLMGIGIGLIMAVWSDVVMTSSDRLLIPQFLQSHVVEFIVASPLLYLLAWWRMSRVVLHGDLRLPDPRKAPRELGLE